MDSIKKLRAMTGAGILDCKKALDSCGNDVDKAIEELRKKGLAKAAKKVDREASEGTLSLFVSAEKKFGFCELNCETDFVAINSEFKEAAKLISKVIAHEQVNSVEEALKIEVDLESLDHRIKMISAKFGENVVLGSVDSGRTDGFFESYIHSDSKIAVVMEAEGVDNEETRDLLKGVAMHVAALDPMALDASSFSHSEINKEKQIYKAELADSGKPPAVIDRIVDGKINKYFENNCLLKQKYVKDNNHTVEDIAKANGIKILSFKRYVLGAR